MSVIQLIFGIILLIGLPSAIYGFIKILIDAFKKSVVEGLLCLFFAPYAIYYAIKVKEDRGIWETWYCFYYVFALISNYIFSPVAFLIGLGALLVVLFILGFIGAIITMIDALNSSTIKGIFVTIGLIGFICVIISNILILIFKIYGASFIPMIIGLVLTPYLFYYVLKEKESASIFEFSLYVSLLLSYCLYISVILMALSTLINFTDILPILLNYVFLPLYIILSILAIVGWVSIIIYAFSLSPIKGILSILFAPYALYIALAQKGKANIFEKLFYVQQIVTYPYLIYLIVTLIIAVLPAIGSLNTILVVLYALLSILALIGFIMILADAFRVSAAKGMFCLLIWPYAVYYVLKEKAKTTLFDVVFFIHQLITYIVVVVLIYPLLKDSVSTLLFLPIYLSIIFYVLSWLFVIGLAFKQSIVKGLASLIIPFYWLYYAITEADVSDKRETVLKWGLGFSIPILLIAAIAIFVPL